MASKPKSIFPISALIILLLQFTDVRAQTVIGGYWFADSGLTIPNINSALYTHLFCSFADLDAPTNRVTISPANSVPFAQFSATVKQRNPSVKTLLSIGGGASNDADYAAMASLASSRKSFIDSSIALARSNGFDGLDLDWEYPVSDAQMTNLGLLLDEWRAAVAAEARSSGKAVLLLTAAVAYKSTSDTNDAAYKYPYAAITRSLDFINVMNYDFYDPSWYRSNTNCHAGLNDASGGASGSAGIQNWRNAGIPANKLVTGIAHYGYVWKLTNPSNNGILAPANGPVDPNNYAMTFKEIRTFISGGATATYNSARVCDYAYKGTTWVGYDGVQSVIAKVNFAKQNKLRGTFVWQIGGDDNWILSQQAKNTWGVRIIKGRDADGDKALVRQ